MRIVVSLALALVVPGLALLGLGQTDFADAVAALLGVGDARAA